MAAAAEEGDLSSFYSWSGLQRLLPIYHPFFEEWDVELQTIISSTPQTASSNPQHTVDDSMGLEPLHSFACTACGSTLLNAHLLDLHLSEVHDPFFEIQAAKRLSIFRCLVEGCQKQFTSTMDRKKHLINAHAYSTAFQFDKLHIGRRQAQPRPAKHFQKAKAKQSGPPLRNDQQRSNMPPRTDRGSSFEQDADPSERTDTDVRAMDVDSLADSFAQLSHNGHKHPPRRPRGRGKRIAL